MSFKSPNHEYDHKRGLLFVNEDDSSFLNVKTKGEVFVSYTSDTSSPYNYGAFAVSEGRTYLGDINNNRITVNLLSNYGTTPTSESHFTRSTNTSANFGKYLAVGCGKIISATDDNDGNDTSGTWLFDADGSNEVDLKSTQGISIKSPNNNEYFQAKYLDINEGRIVVGNPGDSNNALYLRSGSAYILDLNGNILNKIFPDDGYANGYFGHSVSIGCNRIVIGAPGQVELATLGNKSRGKIYIYDLNGNLINKFQSPDTTKTLNDNTIDNFGGCVKIGQGIIAVSEDINRFWGSSGGGKGKVHLFDLNGNLIKTIINPIPNTQKTFGRRIEIGTGRIIIGHMENGAPEMHIYNLKGDFIQTFSNIFNRPVSNFVIKPTAYNTVSPYGIGNASINDRGANVYMMFNNGQASGFNGTGVALTTPDFFTNFDYYNVY